MKISDNSNIKFLNSRIKELKKEIKKKDDSNYDYHFFIQEFNLLNSLKKIMAVEKHLNNYGFQILIQTNQNQIQS
jgi:hypothetical protein